MKQTYQLGKFDCPFTVKGYCVTVHKRPGIKSLGQIDKLRKENYFIMGRYAPRPA